MNERTAYRWRRILAPLCCVIAPFYSTCLRCRMPWKFAKEHGTVYERLPDGRPVAGVFPLCERCWGSLTTRERLPYYRRLAHIQGRPEMEQVFEAACWSEGELELGGGNDTL